MFPDVFLDFVLLEIQLSQYVDPNFLFCGGLCLPLWVSFFFFSSFSLLPAEVVEGVDD